MALVRSKVASHRRSPRAGEESSQHHARPHARPGEGGGGGGGGGGARVEAPPLARSGDDQRQRVCVGVGTVSGTYGIRTNLVSSLVVVVVLLGLLKTQSKFEKDKKITEP
eukprot:SAG31_NODE_20822_length_564_cov_1.746237_1_plen_109_part_01